MALASVIGKILSMLLALGLNIRGEAQKYRGDGNPISDQI